jgi:ankyrin repeat protein
MGCRKRIIRFSTRLLGRTIHQAAKRGDKDAVKELIESGVPPDERDNYGDTPLHYASSAGHMSIAKLLLD